MTTKIKFSLTCLIICLSFSLFGRNTNNTGGGTWSSPSSWNSSLLPSSSESVVILTGDHITTSGDLNHNANISIKNGATLEVNGDISIAWGISISIEQGGILIVKGTLNTRIMTFNNSGEVLTLTQFIQQDGGIVTNSATGIITSYGDFIHNNGIFNNYGTITAYGDLWFTDSGVSTNTGTMNIGGSMFHENGMLNNSGDLNIAGDVTLSEGAQTNNSNGNWIIGGTLSIPTWKVVYNYDGLIEWGNRDYIDPSIIGGTHRVLPINLTHFSALQKNNASITLSWTTATETENNFFTLEVSVDGTLFEVVDEISGAGTTTSEQDYTYNDYNLYDEAILYYRLKQTDYNGAFSYSKTISLKNSHPDSDIKLPTAIKGESIFSSPATLYILDSKGTTVAKADKGESIVIPAQKGIYFWQTDKNMPSQLVVY